MSSLALVKSSGLLLLVCLLAAAPSIAQDEGQQQQERPFGFGPMELTKVGDYARCLQPGDFNGDGLRDLVVADNETAKIVVFLQQRLEPPGDSGEQQLNRFKKEYYLTRMRISAMVAHDLNGDGRSDLVYYGDPPRLVILMRTATGWQTPPQRLDLEDGSRSLYALQVGDVNGDDRPDILLLGEEQYFLLPQSEAGSFGRIQSSVLSETQTSGIFLIDADADGKKDLLFVKFESAFPLRLQRQGPEGLESDIVFELPALGAIEFSDLNQDGKDELLVIESVTGRLKVLSLEEAPSRGAYPIATPRTLSLPPVRSPEDRRVQLGDVNGDGRMDVLVTDRGSSSVQLFRQRSAGAGLTVAEPFPSYCGIIDASIASPTQGAPPCVVLVSEVEQAVGLSQWEEGKLAFPRALPIRGKPRCAAVADINGDGQQDILVAAVERKSHWSIQVLTHDPEEGWGPLPERELTLGEATVGPEALRTAELDGDGSVDLMIVMALEAAQLFRNLPAGWAAVQVPEGPLKNLLTGLRPAQLTILDLEGDGRNEILAAHRNFARAFQLGPDGSASILTQFNARRREAQVASVAVADLDQDGIAEIVLADRQEGCLELLRRHEGKAEWQAELRIPQQELREVRVADFNGDDRQDLLVLTRGHLLWIPVGANEHVLREVALYETEVERGRLQDVAVGDLNADGKPDVLVTEEREARLELLRVPPFDLEAGALQLLQRAYFFRIFERKGPLPSSSSDLVAHRMCVEDLTGDGKRDLILHVHDRFILYPQE